MSSRLNVGVIVGVDVAEGIGVSVDVGVGVHEGGKVGRVCMADVGSPEMIVGGRGVFVGWGVAAQAPTIMDTHNKTSPMRGLLP